jgi:site-specific recombinase XerD
LESPKTGRHYRSNLAKYWEYHLHSRFVTLDDWVASVEKQQEDKDVNVRRTWAIDLEAFINAYTSPKTGRLLVTSARNVVVSAVKNYLKSRLGDRLESYEFTLGTKAERIAEARAKEEAQPVTPEEIKRLYGEAKNRRDRAIISTLPGCGVSEWLLWTREWYKYADDIRAGNVPIRVSTIREKTKISYSVFLFDDAVEDLRELLSERERDLGRPLTQNDSLFANQSGEPITAHDVQRTIRRLADRSGVEPLDRNKVSYRIRPHELGRDYFVTQLALARVSEDVREYLVGHKIDPLAYNKFHRTKEGQDLIAKEASNLRPLLNIRTGRGQPQSQEDRDIELTAQFARKFLDRPDLADKLLKAHAAGRLLDVEALMKEAADLFRGKAPGQVKRYSNHEYDYVHAPVESPEFQQALEEGYEIYGSNGNGLHVLRRKKASLES